MPLLGYCTNVHAGADWRETLANLQRHAAPVKEKCSPSEPMGVGLWFSQRAASELQHENQLPAFRDWLNAQGLRPYTLNGFPFGDFHQSVVKHRVYEPAWWTVEREEYTWRLAEVLDALLPAGNAGSISTLPIAWGNPTPDEALLDQAANRLLRLALRLNDLRESTGRAIVLCLEPEPGCVLDDRHDVLQWFDRLHSRARTSAERSAIAEHLAVCHDICHSVVMFEEQHEAWDAYRSAHIRVGKVQVSSAVVADFDACDDYAGRERMRRQLEAFNEPRYLHQTSVRRGEQTRFYEDLELALREETPEGQWRVHFHVPIFLQHFGELHSSQPQIHDCLRAAAQAGAAPHFEVETYAWNVLPASLAPESLAAGIATEIQWLQAAMASNSRDHGDRP